MPSSNLDEIQTVIGAAERTDIRGADWPRLQRALDDLEESLMEPDAPDARRAGNYARLLGQRAAASFLKSVDDMLKVDFFGYMDGQGLLQG